MSVHYRRLLALIIGAATLEIGQAAIKAGELSNEIPTWTKQGMLQGASSTEQDCVRSDRVWILDKETGYCIRYFKNDVKSSGHAAIFFFNGDFVGSDWDGNGRPIRPIYIPKVDGTALLRTIRNITKSSKDNTLFVLARPGQLGSSGDHKDKYKRYESRVMNAAIDQIKNKYDIKDVVLAGHSGGATLVANILAKRSDVKCAVMGSGAVALHTYAQDSGFDSSVWALWEDPMLSVERIAPTRADYYILAGQDDTIRPPKYQKMYADALTARGLSAHYLVLRKRGDAHDLRPEALQVADACAKGRSLEQIRPNLSLSKSQ